MQYVWMLLTFMYFGCLCLSGGGSLLQFYIDELVNRRHRMTLEGLGNFLAVSQVTPGPIGVNLATFIGYRQGGVFGGLVCTVGLLLPSFFLMSLAVKSYDKWQESRLVKSLMYGVKPITAALILTALFACFGMSVFRTEIPFHWLFGLLAGKWTAYEGDFGIRWEMLPILIPATWVLYKRKMSIMAVIFLSAAAGMGLFYLFGS